MKNCVNCGAEIEDRNKFCPHCGTRCESGEDNESPVTTPIESVPEARNESEQQILTHPMKWHNFLMVIMILGGIVTIANGLNTMNSSGYAGIRYEYSEAQKALIFYVTVAQFDKLSLDNVSSFRTATSGNEPVLDDEWAMVSYDV